MATLVLTTVGSLVAGPIGGAIGAVLGNQVDRAVLKPKGRQGPRLGDLSVQTSAYGLPIPRLFGTMRVAGTVIWATDLRESRHRSGSRKGGGATTTYSYSASFAVALSARPITGVRHIWADGKLLRGSAGDWKSETGFRLHQGGEGQAVDPLIASAESMAKTPAHRGIAYAVFEDMQLADFGNRIPSLTFEVEADPRPVSVAAIAREISGDAIVGSEGEPRLGGFAASGDSVRGALEALAAAIPMPLIDDGAVLRTGDMEPVLLDEMLLGASADAVIHPARARDVAAAATLPDAIALTYYDPARDYQAGLQRARRTGQARQEQRIEMAAALSGATARSWAEGALARAWRERQQVTASLPWRALAVRAGMRVTLHGQVWRVAGWTLEHMALQLRLRPERGGVYTPIPSDPGRATTAPDADAGATQLVLVDLPAWDEAAATTPQLFLAAAGSRPGWRRAEVSLSLDAGQSWREVGQTALPAVIGRSVTALAAGDAALFDRGNMVEVTLLHDAMELSGGDDDALAAGANLAVLGQELIQFGEVRQIGPAAYRLGRLTRGRRGTEWAMGGHAVGETFLLLDRQTLLPMEVPLSGLGATALVTAVGPGDGGVAASAALAVGGQALQPPAPVHLVARRLNDGAIQLRWTRRSREGWPWLDGSDAPLAETIERYRVTLSRQGEVMRAIETAEPTYVYAWSEQVADGLRAGDPISATVLQFGTYAMSTTVSATWSL